MVWVAHHSAATLVPPTVRRGYQGSHSRTMLAAAPWLPHTLPFSVSSAHSNMCSSPNFRITAVAGQTGIAATGAGGAPKPPVGMSRILPKRGCREGSLPPKRSSCRYLMTLNAAAVG